MKCENRSRTTCSRFHRLHSESTLACGSGLWGNTCGTCRPQPPSHTLSKEKKTHSLTLLLQNHQDHLNNLLRDLRHWHIHNLLHDSFRHPLLRNHLDHVNCSKIRGTGTSTISSMCARPPVLSPDACTSVADDLTSNKLHDFLLNLWYWHIHDLLLDLQPDDGHSATAAASGRSGARCAPVVATIKCTMHTCQTLQHKLPRTAVKKKAMMEWTTKTKAMEPIETSANSSDCSTRQQKRETRTFSHMPHAKEKILRETWRARHEIGLYVRTCSVRRLAPPQPSTGRSNDCLFTKGDQKNNK